MAGEDNEDRYYRPVPDTLNNIFRNWEKFYRKPPSGTAVKKIGLKVTDFSDVVDFTNLDNNTGENRTRIIDMSEDIFPVECMNDMVPEIKKFYGIEGVPGLLVIPNPFTAEQQIYWTDRLVRKYTLHNPTNVVNVKMINWRKEKENQFTPEEEEEIEKVIIGWIIFVLD